MAYRFDFDSANQILRTQFEGQVTDDELKEFYQLAVQVAAKTCPRARILDFSAVTSFEVSPGTVRDLALSPPPMPNPNDPRCVVAPSPNIFGMARMFQSLAEATRPNLHVVHTLREAYAILGVQHPKFKPLRAD